MKNIIKNCLYTKTKLQKHGGFTLIEVIVAMAILMIIITSVFMLITVSVVNLKDSEQRDVAKNIAVYAVEYLRSRNVTIDNNFIGTTDWYSSHNPIGKYPGLVDLGNNPLEKNSSVLTLSINSNPVLPSNNYGAAGGFYSSLQGYVSFPDTPTNAETSVEDANAKVVGEKYYDKITNDLYIIRFPADIISSTATRNFTALAGYNGKIYTSNANCVNNSKAEYDPHYTAMEENTRAYRGFRILTQVVARKGLASEPAHVQYYDVKVTVFWLLGNLEHSYSIATQIITYGGGA